MTAYFGVNRKTVKCPITHNSYIFPYHNKILKSSYPDGELGRAIRPSEVSTAKNSKISKIFL